MNQNHPLLNRLSVHRSSLTPKGCVLADYVIQNPRQAVFMTTRELARSCGVSEATVVRFVVQLGYAGYSDFIQDLRDLVDTELTLVDRVELEDSNAPGSDRLRRVVNEEIDNLKKFYESMDPEIIGQAAGMLLESPHIYVIGSRASYTFAYYMGWSLTKLRSHIHILKGSDSTTIDWLTLAPEGSMAIVFAVSRYPNELIRAAKLVRRLDHRLMVISDSALCPLNQFAHLPIVVKSLHFPLIGSPSPMGCLVNCLVAEMAARGGDTTRLHQERLEQVYREHDLLFNLDGMQKNNHSDIMDH